jgi:choline dehydrogenase-like flavoprotein
MKIVVVGSGAGGATVARELSRNGISVTLIDKGPLIKPKNAHKYYETFQTGVEIMNTSCLGGTTMVTVGNAVRTCQHDLEKRGIKLEDEFLEVERELKVRTLPDSHFGPGTRKIMAASQTLGFNMDKMPKFIDPEKCEPCGKCAFGCSKDGKWTSLKYVEEAQQYGAAIVDNTLVTELITSKGEVKGVKSLKKDYKADMVILSAGAIETPRILIKEGINAGNNLFVDTFVTVGGLLKGVKFNKEVQMNSLIKSDKVILAPHFSEVLKEKLKKSKARKKDILGMMVKIQDEASGRVTPESVIKYNTAQDVELLSQGSAQAGAILKEAGADPRTLISTPARGAHPGGTAALGDVVDKNLETEISGLFVADASVFPQAPGAPPILTILALAKRLAKYIVNDRVNI